ncbi:hypothetical protein ACFL0U_03770 [Pseudomonadota bacterium]
MQLEWRLTASEEELSEWLDDLRCGRNPNIVYYGNESEYKAACGELLRDERWRPKNFSDRFKAQLERDGRKRVDELEKFAGGYILCGAFKIDKIEIREAPPKVPQPVKGKEGRE